MMKRLFSLLFLLLFLCGCAAEKSLETTETTQAPTQESTEAAVSWIEAVGMPWDQEGALLEIPLTIPDGIHYSSSTEFDGDLLLWSLDHHMEDTCILELCLVSLHDGSVLAQRDLAFSQTVTPQVLGGKLYLCDSASGYIEQLDKSLTTVQSWDTDPQEGNWFMGAEEKLYIFGWENNVLVRDLSTGETYSLMEDGAAVQYAMLCGESLSIDYYGKDTGAPAYAVLDLVTGELNDLDFNGNVSSASLVEDDWLCGYYMDGYSYYLSVDGEPFQRIRAEGEGTFRLLDGEYLLYTNEENTDLKLYNLWGKALAQCQLSAAVYTYTTDVLIWSEEFGGYFCPLSDYDGNQRLLFWDIQAGTAGEDLTLEPIPEVSETEAFLKQRAQEIGEKYGLMIQVCSDCDTVFDEFTATLADDFEQVNAALDTLDEALSVYPEGFFRQLRYDSIYSIRIQLVQDLMANGSSGRYGDGYSAFTQNKWDYYLMVVDIQETFDFTYYHEFSHIIDSYLEWDSWQREDALYSEETWNSLNPSWFGGYSYDYAQEHELEDYTSFVDGYATISPTEDRARIMEYAMSDFGQWTFEDADILLQKLDYYCRCIRDAFDTESWPDTVLWEQYLHLEE